ncbi:NO-inducible flavohemoprotein [Halomonas sp. 18H]|uniref:NO-inducible flavohemoprotein n=1 Tax=Halomonas almeriensis TaxID=308163 RepID=UPI00222F4AB8|nr:MULTISPECIES: NO-inducible flavohemoprotein [Halomonas]MCW4153345.1 NO-inducible flavohemoprotein [Halomonas sp. 18H]MDN3553772.1 NO-inducible flavohemoprotein [Halomonas almeriensis]
MLTQTQETLIAQTAPVVAEHLNTITAHFYPLMFERYPEVKPLFNQAHQANGGQPRALASSVLAYVQLRQDPARAREVLEGVVNKHVSLNIRPDQYPIVGECLMAAIGDVLGDAVTPEIADAWGALYQELADLLIELEGQRYQAFAETPGGWRGERRFRIASTRQESAVIRSFVLEPEDGQPVADFQPGQFIGVRLMIGDTPVYRHYSLSGSPNGHSYRISIKRETDGLASGHFHECLGVGDVIELLPPAGDLTLPAAPDSPIMLLSGGVGQTPMLSLLRQALQEGRRVTYLHAAQDEAHHAFREEVNACLSEHPDQLTVVTLHENAASNPPSAPAGRVTQALLAQYLPDDTTHCYFVGPQGFMEAVNGYLKALGVPEGQRHFEHFGPARELAAA